MFTKRDFLRSAAFCCNRRCDDSVGASNSATNTDRLGFKARGIAEAEFIFGLPIEMNYGVMYEYAVDRNSGPAATQAIDFPARDKRIA